MVEMQALISEDDTEVELLWTAEPPDPDFSLTFTAAELESFIDILMEVRTHLKPPLSRA
jgi:hypothetical protein